MTAELPVFTVADLEELASIEFEHFTNDDAFDLGVIAANLIRERDLNLAVEIVIGDDLVFRAKLKNTDKGNDEWLSGKANVTRLFGEPSLLVRRRHTEAGTVFTDLDLDHETHKAYGGCIPIRVGGQIVATITTSGEPDVIDHQTAADAIQAYLAR
jgi:uncharacterized protein (UPF0303 family)